MGPYIVGAIALLVLIGIGLAFAWQERREVPGDATIYGVEDAIEYVMQRFGEDPERPKRSDVRRILEWEMRYLQSPELRDEARPAVVGGLDAAEYAQQQLHQRGFTYDGGIILRVLDYQAEYLAALGVVGEPVAGDEFDQVLAQDEPARRHEPGDDIQVVT